MEFRATRGAFSRTNYSERNPFRALHHLIVNGDMTLHEFRGIWIFFVWQMKL